MVKTAEVQHADDKTTSSLPCSRWAATLRTSTHSSSNSSSKSSHISRDVAASQSDDSNKQATPAPTAATWTPHLLARLEAERQRANDPVYMDKLREAAATPINVVVMTSLFWTLSPKQTDGCSLHGVPLDCRVSQRADEVSALGYARGDYTQ